jgi:transglutaminase-like putative cysteine protease
MRLQVLHRTRYQYASLVSDSFNEARLRPADTAGQTCERFLLKVLPATRLSHYVDFQRNYVHLFDLTEPHAELVVEATSVIATTDRGRLPEDLTTTSLASMSEYARLEGCHDFLQGSRYVELTPEAWRFGLDVTAGLTDVWQAAQALSQHIHRTFTYQPAATTVHTPMAEALRTRHGVCQDFAHVLIGACRSLRIPARYVSGYLYNGPADQLRGAQASHAWVEVFVPGLGWHGLDPTNGGQPDARYVRIGAGRDYADVSPLRGTYRGTPQRKMTVEVLVTALESLAAVS